ncbi:DUF6053 domain-containing protein [Lysobacter yananisis]|uniref:DUF6053 domain-containing protein n=1 Tax=Lysobacter yananisis TaxID=1003114 RepID=UPI003CE5C12A
MGGPSGPMLSFQFATIRQKSVGAAAPPTNTPAFAMPQAFVRGPSGPTLLLRIAANRPKSVGPEGPPHKSAPALFRIGPQRPPARTVPPPSPLAHVVCAILAVLRFRPRSSA